MKKLKKCTALLLALLLLFTATPVAAKPTKPRIIPLKAGKVYKGYDFTGDGKKDKFKWKCSGSYGSGETAKIYINNKLRNKIDLARGGVRTDGGDGLYLCIANKKTVFLLATHGQFGANNCSAYIYKNGKFKSVYASFQKYAFDYCFPKKITKNALYIYTLSGKHSQIFTYEADRPSCLVKYRIQNKKIKLASKKAAVSGTYTATRSFFTSSSTARLNANGVFVPSGSQVQLRQVHFTGKGYALLKIVVNGKTGWIPDNGNDVYGSFSLTGALK